MVIVATSIQCGHCGCVAVVSLLYGHCGFVVLQSVFWPLTSTVLTSLQKDDTKVYTKVQLRSLENCDGDTDSSDDYDNDNDTKQNTKHYHHTRHLHVVCLQMKLT